MAVLGPNYPALNDPLVGLSDAAATQLHRMLQDVQRAFQILDGAQPYDIAVCFPGLLSASLTFRYTAPRPIVFGTNFGSGSKTGGKAQASADVASAGTTTLTIDAALAATPNTFSNIGSIVFTTSDVGVITSSFGAFPMYTLEMGDVLHIVCPVSPDANLSGVSITLPGAR